MYFISAGAAFFPRKSFNIIHEAGAVHAREQSKIKWKGEQAKSQWRENEDDWYKCIVAGPDEPLL